MMYRLARIININRIKQMVLTKHRVLINKNYIYQKE